LRGKPCLSTDRSTEVETTADMLNAVQKEMATGSVLIMAAAPADYTPVERSDRKIKKGSGGITIEFKKTPDILKEVARMRREGTVQSVFTVGFAAETDDIEKYALKKLQEKNLDMICLNDVSRRDAGFGTDTNIITIFLKGGSRIELPMIAKKEVAERILTEIESRLPKYLT
jgi:phosphopantothenoylcysteine decarboxylase/phosphopantothenate--cysteine ligase